MARHNRLSVGHCRWETWRQAPTRNSFLGLFDFRPENVRVKVFGRFDHIYTAVRKRE